DLMVKHPELIRRPLLFNDQQLQVGFSEDDIRSFLPRQVRRKHLKALMSAEAD
ncbi:transcriptional regulator Spx domain protein, partial [Lentilactobacillus hilgardii ATCC 27305]